MIPTDGTVQHHTFEPAGDQDWIRFSATLGNVYTTETFNLGDSDTKLYLYDTDGTTVLVYNDDGGAEYRASKIVWVATGSGDHYLKVVEYGGHGGPTYTYDINVTMYVPAPDAYEPDDAPGQASLIPTDGTIQSHTFHAPGDVDWIRFSATLGNVYTTETFNLGESDTELYLYDTDGTTVLAYDDDGGHEYRASKIVWVATGSGDHYLKVVEYGGHGGPTYTYDVNVTMYAPTMDAYEPDDTPGEASVIPTDGTIQSHTFHAPGDVDWIRFSATLGNVYTTETFNLGESDTELYLYDTDGTTVLAYDDDGGAEYHASEIEWVATASGDYYLKVMEYGGDGGSTYTYDIRVLSTTSTGSQFGAFIKPTELTTSVGTLVSYHMEVYNNGPSVDIFRLDVTGLDPAWCTLSEIRTTLGSGERSGVVLAVGVPASAIPGAYPFDVNVNSTVGNQTESAHALLTVTREPTISDLHPRDGTIAGSRDILFTWTTSINSTTEVFLRRASDSTYVHHVGQDSSVHSLAVVGLERNTAYRFYVTSSSLYGASTSGVRSLYLDNGIAFSEREYNFTVERDYDQRKTITVVNTDDEPHSLLVTVENPHDDLVVGFVGNGSQGRIVALDAGEAEDLTLAVHAQDAFQLDYEVLLNLSSMPTDGVGETVYDYARVNLHVRYVNADFTVSEISTDPYTLAKTIRVQNLGDVLTDFSIWVSDGLKGLVSFDPLIHHANLNFGEILEFEVAPLLSLDFVGINGTLFAQGYAKVVTLALDFTLPPGFEVFLGDIDASGSVTSYGQYCTNKVAWDRPIQTPPWAKGGMSPVKYATGKLWYSILDAIGAPPVPAEVPGDGGGIRGAELRPNVARHLQYLYSDNFDYPSFVILGDVLHAVHHSNESGNTDVYYSRYRVRLTVPEVTEGSVQREARYEFVRESSVNLSSSPGNSTWPSIAVFGSNLSVFWVENVSGDTEIYSARSPDNGTSWGTPRPLTNTVGAVDDPYVAIDSTGTIHVVWEDFRFGESEIFYIDSADGGVTWSPEERLTSTPGNSEYASIAVDSNDVLHAVWEDYRSGFGQIFYKQSTNRGLAWSPDKLVSLGSIDAGEPSIVVTQNDVVHVVWRDSRHGESEVYYRNSTDGGATWGSENRLTNDASYSEYPAIVPTSRNAIRVYWHDNRTGDDLPYFMDGTPWGEVKRVPRTDPNVLEVFLEMNFELKAAESSYLRHHVFVSINGHQVAALIDTIPNGRYLVRVDPSFLNYGDGEVVSNVIHTRTEKLGYGSYHVSAGKTLLFHLSYADMPVVASNQSQADSIAKSLTTLAWQGVDPAVYVNDIGSSNSAPSEGETTIISANIRNLGEDDVSNVAVQFLDGNPDTGGTQIGPDATIPFIASYGSATLSTTWTSPGGTHRIYVVIDRANGISETREDNNIAFKTLYVYSTVPPTGAVQINGGAGYTGSRNVRLNLSATGLNPIVQYAVSRNGLTWSVWYPYITHLAFTLLDRDGTQSVYVRYRDAASLVSAVASDSIILDRAGPIGSITINNGDAFTRSTSVTLSLTATDPLGTADGMSFSNDKVQWTNWEPYGTSKTWSIPSGDGIKTVYVKFRDKALAESTVYSDDIWLDSTPPRVMARAPYGTSIAANTTVVLAFSEPMGRASVEGAFSITPRVAGVFTWDDANVSFTPSENLDLGQKYNVTIGTGARDLAGNNLVNAFSWEFTVESSPAGGEKGVDYTPYIAPIGVAVLAAVVILYLFTRRKKPLPSAEAPWDTKGEEGKAFAGDETKGDEGQRAERAGR